MRLLIVQTSFLGDVVLTTPLIDRLAERGAVDVVTAPAAAALLANHPSIRTVIPYDKRGSERGPVGFTRLALRLRREGYTAAYLAQGSVRSGALTMLAGIPQRIGFDSSSGRGFYTQRIPYIENDHHAARLLSLAGPTGGEVRRPRLCPGPADRDAVTALLSGVDATRRIVGFAPGSVWATKRWPAYPALAAAIDGGATIVVIGSAQDGPLAADIAAAAPERVIDATGRLSLLASAELVRRCSVLITNDSLPQHLASAMNTPTVSIFGPTVPAFGFGPLADRSTTVGVDALACRPCDRHGPRECPLGHWKCMVDVPATRVLEAIRELA